MKRLLLGGVAVVLLVVAAAFSIDPPLLTPILQVKVEDRNPWTNLRLNNDADDFQFVIVSDRTGGHREKVFSRAVEQINLLQPEFVVSVGDLIEGYTDKPEQMAKEWREFQGYVAKLKMPFFYVAGNHDVSNKAMEKAWQEKFGRRYYHFVYKDVLFLMLCSDDPAGSGTISQEQIEYVKQAVEENARPRWTVVALHKPIWTAKDLEKNGWAAVEKLLMGRNYTVFAGHVHRYEKFVRNGMNYYQLATTGGGSRMRGTQYGEFDHIVWVTMKKSGPVLANIMLDGIYPENMSIFPSDEQAVPSQRKPTHPVKGTVHLDGVPAVGAMVVFSLKNSTGKGLTRVADGVVEADGSFVLSTYTAWDGAPEGEYIVTVGRAYAGGDEAARLPAGAIPMAYGNPETSGLTAKVKPGANEFTFNLKREPPMTTTAGGN